MIDTAYHETSKLRGLAAKLCHAMPPFRGRGRAIRVLNSAFNRAGLGPLVAADMKLDYRMVVDLRSRTEYLSYYTGDYDTGNIRAIVGLFEPGWQVLDVGAHIGYYTVPFAMRLAPLGGRVWALEPVAYNVARLRENVELNGVGHAVTVVEVALSDRRGQAAITLREDFQAGAETGNAALVIEDGTDREFDTVSVAVDTLDNVCRERNIRHVDFIKADVEGHEDLLFSGGMETIRRDRPLILAEMNEDYFRRRGIDLTARMDAIFGEAEYCYLGAGGRGRWRRIMSLAGRGPADDVLLVPAERVDRLSEKLAAP